MNKDLNRYDKTCYLDKLYKATSIVRNLGETGYAYCDLRVLPVDRSLRRNSNSFQDESVSLT